MDAGRLPPPQQPSSDRPGAFREGSLPNLKELILEDLRGLVRQHGTRSLEVKSFIQDQSALHEGFKERAFAFLLACEAADELDEG